MKRPILLHQLCAADLTLDAFIALAAANDCHTVSVFGFDGATVLPRSNTGLSYPTAITRETQAGVQRAMKEHHVAIDGVEFFPLTNDVDVEIYKPAIAMAAELGAKRVVCHMFIEDDALAVEKLGKFCALAEAEGLNVTSEFCPLTKGNPNLNRAKWLADQVGAKNFGIGVDTLHVVRSGATAADIAALEPRYFGIVQINDAHGTHASSDYIKDVHNREVPGQGDLPLHDLLSAVPASFPIEAEVPAAHRRLAGITAAQHVRDVLAGTRAVVEKLAPFR
jgi:sugar phosphate isomerase/epimerase